MSYASRILIVFSIVMSLASCGKPEEQPASAKQEQHKKQEGIGPSTLLPISVSGNTGYIDMAGKVIIDPKFIRGHEFSEGLALVAAGGTLTHPNRYGYIDSSGNFAILPQFDEARNFSQGLAAVMVGGVDEPESRRENHGRWGFVDPAGKFVINPQFANVGNFGKNGLAPVLVAEQSNDESHEKWTEGGKWAYIDRSGKITIQPQFHDAKEFSEGLAAVEVWEEVPIGVKEDKAGSLVVVHGKSGKGGVYLPTVIRGKKRYGYAWVQYGFIDEIGHFAIPEKFNRARSFSEGLAAVQIGGKWGYIDKTGKLKIPAVFAYAGSFSNGLAPVAKEDKSTVGYVDKTGTFVIAPQFVVGSAFSEGRAAVSIGAAPRKGGWVTVVANGRPVLGASPGSKVGFIDVSGALVINPQFGRATDFEQGVAQVTWAGSNDTGWINSTGALIYDPRLQSSSTSPDKTGSNSNSNRRTRFAGSGFFVSNEGHIVTNYHIGGECKEIRVPSLNQSAQFIRGDSVNDLALLKVSEKPVRGIAVFRRSDDIEQGEHVVLYGYPLSGVLAASGNLSSGQVSALTGLANNVSQIQISAPVQQGNSGGPLLDRKGRVIGVVVSKLSAVKVASATGDIPQNVNFAINLHTTKAFLNSQQIKYETSSFFARERSDEDIASQARQFTLAIECLK